MTQTHPFDPQGLLPQDLHIHTTFSKTDSAVVPEQTLELIAQVRHARVIGISDHLESVIDEFPDYAAAVRAQGFRLGVEVNGAEWVAEAEKLELEYFIYHCRDQAADYRGAERLLSAGRPVVIAHPGALQTDLRRVPSACLIEINNRYAWRQASYLHLREFAEAFRFVIGSDAHQPHWLNQNLARWAARQIGVRETLLFAPMGKVFAP